jgi:hypothetical protein
MLNINVNGTLVEMTPEQVDDIVSQAYNVIVVSRMECPEPEQSQAIAELYEAMVAAGAVEPEE